MLVNIGKLDKKIKIYEEKKEKDSDGFETTSESLLLSSWAQVTNTSGTTVIKSNADFEDVKTRFLIRTPKIELTHDMYIQFNNSRYDILYVNDYEYDRHFTEIFAKKVEL